MRRRYAIAHVQVLAEFAAPTTSADIGRAVYVDSRGRFTLRQVSKSGGRERVGFLRSAGAAPVVIVTGMTVTRQGYNKIMKTVVGPA